MLDYLTLDDVASRWPPLVIELNGEGDLSFPKRAALLVAAAQVLLRKRWVRVKEFNTLAESRVTSVGCVRAANDGLLLHNPVSARINLYAMSEQGVRDLGAYHFNSEECAQLLWYAREASLELEYHPEGKKSLLQAVAEKLGCDGSISAVAAALDMEADAFRRCLYGRGKRDGRVRIALVMGRAPSEIWDDADPLDDDEFMRRLL